MKWPAECVLCLPLGLAYLPMPKVASTSIKQVLAAAQGLRPRTEKELHTTLPTASVYEAQQQKLLVFTVVRNPYDRLASVWRQRLAGREAGTTRLTLRRTGFSPDMTFPEFVLRLEQVGLGVDPHLPQQTSRLRSAGGLPLMVFRFETLAAHWQLLQRLVPALPALPHLNAAAQLTISYRKSYSKAARHIAGHLYLDDVKMLGYRF